MDMVIKQFVQVRAGVGASSAAIVIPKHLTKLGDGVEAVVYHNNNKQGDVGVVTKWISNSAVSYHSHGTIQYLIKGNQAGNIHVPVVYQIKQVALSNGNYSFSIQMEKLHCTIAGVEFDSHQLYALASNTIGSYWDQIDHSADTAISLVRLLADAIQYSESSLLPNCCKSFRQLAYLVNHAKLISSCGFDMHGHNWMVRHTSVGMQLVLIDPLW